MAKGHLQAKSIRSLARLVGRSESAVRKWVGREDWPFSLNPPWDVARIKAWMEVHLSPDPVAAYQKKARAAEAGSGEFREMSPLNKARLQAVLERALLTRQRRLIEAGKMHDTAACEQGQVRKIHEVKNRLMNVGHSLANALVGQDAATIEARLTAWARGVCNNFAAGSPPATDEGKHGSETKPN